MTDAALTATRAQFSPIFNGVEKAVRLTLPFPPSVNRIWRSVNGRTVSAAPYRKWMAEAIQLVRLQRAGRQPGQFVVTVAVQRPDNRPRDLDNLLKPILDCLKNAGVIDDDSKAQGVTIFWSGEAPRKDACVSVLVEAAA